MKHFIISLVFILLISCKEYQLSEKNFPVFKTLPVQRDSAGHIFQAKFIEDGSAIVIKMGFIITAKTRNVISADTVWKSEVNEEAIFTMRKDSGLIKGVEYQVQAVAETAKHTFVYSNTVTFINRERKNTSWFPEDDF